MARTTVFDLARIKQEGRRFAMLTAYDYSSALIAEASGARVLLVGDSMGNVVHGAADTLGVTVEDILRATRSVTRATTQALVVADMPFLSFRDEATAVASAGRFMAEGGAQAVKLEGAGSALPIVSRLVELGVPVMGHLGFTPQSAATIGLKVQARDIEGARRLIEDAEALEAAGAFALVLELVPAPLAAEVTRRLRIPVIGIGAGPDCDGQVQVWHDLLGLFEGRSPRHAKRYAEIGQAMREAVAAYVADVESGAFPTEAQSAKMDVGDLEAALGAVYGAGGNGWD